MPLGRDFAQLLGLGVKRLNVQQINFQAVFAQSSNITGEPLNAEKQQRIQCRHQQTGG